MAIVGSRGFVISVRHQPLQDLSRVEERVDSEPERVANGAGYVLYALLDELVDGYKPIVRSFEERVQDVERDLAAEAYDRRKVSAAYALKRDALELRLIVAPLDEVLDEICERDVEAIGRDLDAELRDVRDHVQRDRARLDA